MIVPKLVTTFSTDNKPSPKPISFLENQQFSKPVGLLGATRSHTPLSSLPEIVEQRLKNKPNSALPSLVDEQQADKHSLLRPVVPMNIPYPVKAATTTLESVTEYHSGKLCDKRCADHAHCEFNRNEEMICVCDKGWSGDGGFCTGNKY